MLIQITFRILNAKLHNFLVVNNDRIAWVSYTQEIRTFFASNIKFGISLNKVYVSKNFLVIY